jgi:hypothetical protein
MKFFRTFAEHPFGSWVVNGLAVVAFILALKLVTNQFLPEKGVPGAIKAGVQSI